MDLFFCGKKLSELQVSELDRIAVMIAQEKHMAEVEAAWKLFFNTSLAGLVTKKDLLPGAMTDIDEMVQWTMLQASNDDDTELHSVLEDLQQANEEKQQKRKYLEKTKAHLRTLASKLVDQALTQEKETHQQQDLAQQQLDQHEEERTLANAQIERQKAEADERADRIMSGATNALDIGIASGAAPAIGAHQDTSKTRVRIILTIGVAALLFGAGIGYIVFTQVNIPNTPTKTETPAPTSTTKPTATPTPTSKSTPTFSLAADGTSGNLKSIIKLSGTLSTPKTGTVILDWAIDNLDFVFHSTEKIYNGEFSRSFSFSQTGKWQFKARWIGDETSSLAESNVIEVTIIQ